MESLSNTPFLLARGYTPYGGLQLKVSNSVGDPNTLNLDPDNFGSRVMLSLQKKKKKINLSFSLYLHLKTIFFLTIRK